MNANKAFHRTAHKAPPVTADVGRRVMRQLIATFVMVAVLTGCKSSGTTRLKTLNTLHEQDIYASLKNEPIPLPRTTPYDHDAEKRRVFNEAFRAGWDCAISGALLHGTFGTPIELSEKMNPIWTAGWQAGTKAGSDRWMIEAQRERNRTGQQGAPPYGAQGAAGER